jgi:hypothetical protein
VELLVEVVVAPLMVVFAPLVVTAPPVVEPPVGPALVEPTPGAPPPELALAVAPSLLVPSASGLPPQPTANPSKSKEQGTWPTIFECFTGCGLLR